MKDTTKAWVTPAGFALLFALMGSAGSYAVMASQVRTNTASISIITDALAKQMKDTVTEIEGKLAVLRAKAQNGGLSDGEQLEYEWLEKRLKDLK